MFLNSLSLQSNARSEVLLLRFFALFLNEGTPPTPARLPILQRGGCGHREGKRRSFGQTQRGTPTPLESQEVKIIHLLKMDRREVSHPAAAGRAASRLHVCRKSTDQSSSDGFHRLDPLGRARLETSAGWGGRPIVQRTRM